MGEGSHDRVPSRYPVDRGRCSHAKKTAGEVARTTPAVTAASQHRISPAGLEPARLAFGALLSQLSYDEEDRVYLAIPAISTVDTSSLRQ